MIRKKGRPAPSWLIIWSTVPSAASAAARFAPLIM